MSSLVELTLFFMGIDACRTASTAQISIEARTASWCTWAETWHPAPSLQASARYDGDLHLRLLIKISATFLAPTTSFSGAQSRPTAAEDFPYLMDL
jgi:hypothetical protein